MGLTNVQNALERRTSLAVIWYPIKRWWSWWWWLRVRPACSGPGESASPPFPPHSSLPFPSFPQYHILILLTTSLPFCLPLSAARGSGRFLKPRDPGPQTKFRAGLTCLFLTISVLFVRTKLPKYRVTEANLTFTSYRGQVPVAAASGRPCLALRLGSLALFQHPKSIIKSSLVCFLCILFCRIYCSWLEHTFSGTELYYQDALQK